MSQNVKYKGLVTIDLYFFPVQVEIRTNLPIIPEVLHSVLSVYFESSKKQDFSDSHTCRSCGLMRVVPPTVVVVSVTAVTWGANSYRSQC